jgi:hypothetical protein
MDLNEATSQPLPGTAGVWGHGNSGYGENPVFSLPDLKFPVNERK